MLVYKHWRRNTIPRMCLSSLQPLLRQQEQGQQGQCQGVFTPMGILQNVWMFVAASLQMERLSKCKYHPFNASTLSFLTHNFSYDCNGTPAQQWTLTAGGTSVTLYGTGYCLDAGSGKSPQPPSIFHSWLIAKPLPTALAWRSGNVTRVSLPRLGPIQRINASLWAVQVCYFVYLYLVHFLSSLVIAAQCLDLPSGSTTNGLQVQTWQCSANNNNQVWTFPWSRNRSKSRVRHIVSAWTFF